MVQNGDLAFGIDGDEPRLVLLELVQVDVDALAFPTTTLQPNEACPEAGERL